MLFKMYIPFLKASLQVKYYVPYQVLLHGIKTSLRATTLEGISEQTLITFVERSKAAYAIIDRAVSNLIADAAADTASTSADSTHAEAPDTNTTPPKVHCAYLLGRNEWGLVFPCQRQGSRRSDGGTSRSSSAMSDASPTTPTRASRRLQAKQDARTEPLPLPNPDPVLNNAPLERALLALARFPTASRRHRAGGGPWAVAGGCASTSSRSRGSLCGRWCCG